MFKIMMRMLGQIMGCGYCVASNNHTYDDKDDDEEEEDDDVDDDEEDAHAN